MMIDENSNIEGYNEKLAVNLDLKKARYNLIINELENTKMSINEFIELKKKATNLSFQIETDENILNGMFKNNYINTPFIVLTNLR